MLVRTRTDEKRSKGTADLSTIRTKPTDLLRQMLVSDPITHVQIQNGQNRTKSTAEETKAWKSGLARELTIGIEKP